MVISAPTLRNIKIDLSMFYWPNLVSNDKKSSTVKEFCQTRLYVYQFRESYPLIVHCSIHSPDTFLVSNFTSTLEISPYLLAYSGQTIYRQKYREKKQFLR